MAESKYLTNKSKVELELYKQKLAAAEEQLSGYEQIMATEKLRGEPGIAERGDWDNIPGFANIQARFQAQERKKMPYQPQGMAQNFAKGKAEEEKSKEKYRLDPVVMGPQGFRKGSSKDQTYANIMTQGGPKSTGEKLWINKFLGVKASKNGPETPQDIVRVRKVAKDMAQAAFMDQGVDTKPGEEDIQMQMAEATKLLYPKTPPEKIEQIDYSITLPDNIKKQSQAVEYLIKQGLDEEEAKTWITERL